MATPRVLILRAPGANCDHEAQFAFEQAGGMAERRAPLESLAARTRLAWHSVERIGGDLRVIARVLNAGAA